MADFDGSLPRAALQELLPDLEEGQYDTAANQGYRLVIAASKVDLLPPQATSTRLQVQTSAYTVRCGGDTSLPLYKLVQMQWALGMCPEGRVESHRDFETCAAHP